MKKRLLGAILASVLSISMLAGCGGRQEPVGETSPDS